MTVTTINLKVRGGKIKAFANGNKVNKGNVVATPGAEIHWYGPAASRDTPFYVRFQDLYEADENRYEWPFSSPTEAEFPDGRLPVPTGEDSDDPVVTVLKADYARLWKYEVTRDGAEDLDPMIIVREARIAHPRRVGVYAVGAIAFLVGVLLGQRRT